MNFIIYLLLSLFYILSRSNYVFGVESSIAEISQIIILSSCLIIIIMNKSIFLSHVNKFVYFSKIIFFLFFLYEEISFLTSGLSGYFNLINSQAEINFHRLLFLYNSFLDIKFPIINYEINITYRFFFYTLALFILGYGSYIPFLKKFKIIFFEKEIAHFSFVYLINLFFISANTQLLDRFLFPKMDAELLEYFLLY